MVTHSETRGGSPNAISFRVEDGGLIDVAGADQAFERHQYKNGGAIGSGKRYL